MKLYIVKFLIGWLWRHYRFLILDVAVPANAHVHRNPRKRPPAGPMFPQPGVSGTDE